MSQRSLEITFCLCAALCLLPWVNAPMALVAGCLFVQIFGNPYAKSLGKFSGTLLKASVVGLGFSMHIDSALQVGRDGFWLTLASISLILVLGFLFGGWLKIPHRVSHLLASGTAICGGSAIAAVGPAVRASAQEMSVALGVVFSLNAVALILFPVIGHWLGLDQYQFGMWCALAIHDTSSVVGAASAYGKEALAVATTVKLARALWVIPLTLLSALCFRSGSRTVRVPLFILGFIVAVLVNSWLPLPDWLPQGIVWLSRRVLVLCLFCIGTALSWQTLRTVGWRPMALGLLLWIVISVLSVPAIVFFA